MKLYTLNYNNYTNRIYKFHSNIADYLAEDANAYVEEDIVNFNYADNITTKQVLLNYNLSTDPDYAILCDDDDNIESRWFVTEAVYNSKFQYTVSLLRDVLVDYPDWKDAIGKVHRGWISNIQNPLLFQKEGSGYNQIKSAQALLYDKTKTPWVVAYANDQFSGRQTIQVPAIYDELSTQTLAQFQAAHINGVLANPEYARIQANVNIGPNSIPERRHTWVVNQYLNGYAPQPVELNTKYETNCVNIENYIQWDDLAAKDQKCLQSFSKGTYVNTLVQSRMGTSTNVQEYQHWDGKIVKFSNNIIKRIRLVTDDYSGAETITNANERNRIQSEFSFVNGYNIFAIEGNPYSFEYECSKLTLAYEDVGSGAFTIDVPTDHMHTVDATLDVIAFPLGNGFKLRTAAANVVIVQNNNSIAIGNSLNATNGIQDVQILPYCPIPQVDSTTITTYNLPETSYVHVKDGNDAIVNTLFFLSSCSFTKTIQSTVTATQVAADVTSTKVAFDTKFCRLCSPNYTSVYEFNPVLNRTGNNIQCMPRFTVTATYKPFTPYIKIVPEFGGIYGRNFKDNRGLILSGSFSLDKINNALNSYYATNKNFENIFNREIQSLELQNQIGRQQDIAALITGTIQGAGVGSVMGKAYGATGAAIGGVIGGGASLAAGIMDLNNNAKLRADALDSRKDMFQFQIGNIMATPSTLVQSTAFNIDNLYVPFIEGYSATDTEIQLLIQKLDYFGMTINAVDTISNYMENGKWISATPLILNGKYDMHTAETIKNELTTGVYVWA